MADPIDTGFPVVPDVYDVTFSLTTGNFLSSLRSYTPYFDLLIKTDRGGPNDYDPIIQNDVDYSVVSPYVEWYPPQAKPVKFQWGYAATDSEFEDLRLSFVAAQLLHWDEFTQRQLKNKDRLLATYGGDGVATKSQPKEFSGNPPPSKNGTLTQPVFSELFTQPYIPPGHVPSYYPTPVGTVQEDGVTTEIGHILTGEGEVSSRLEGASVVLKKSFTKRWKVSKFVGDIISIEIADELHESPPTGQYLYTFQLDAYWPSPLPPGSGNYFPVGAVTLPNKYWYGGLWIALASADALYPRMEMWCNWVFSEVVLVAGGTLVSSQVTKHDVLVGPVYYNLGPNYPSGGIGPFSPEDSRFPDPPGWINYTVELTYMVGGSEVKCPISLGGRWWQQPSPSFGQITPLDYVVEGKKVLNQIRQVNEVLRMPTHKTTTVLGTRLWVSGDGGNGEGSFWEDIVSYEASSSPEQDLAYDSMVAEHPHWSVTRGATPLTQEVGEDLPGLYVSKVSHLCKYKVELEEGDFGTVEATLTKRDYLQTSAPGV